MTSTRRRTGVATTRRAVWPRATWSARRTATLGDVPAIGAATTCSIFIASRVTIGSPASTTARRPRRGRRAPRPASAPATSPVRRRMVRDRPPGRPDRRRAAARAGTRRSGRRRRRGRSVADRATSRGRSAADPARRVPGAPRPAPIAPSRRRRRAGRRGRALSRQPPARSRSRRSERAAAAAQRLGRERRRVAAQSSGGQIRSRVSMRTSPSRTDGLPDEPAQEPQVRREAQDDGRRRARPRAGRAPPRGPGRQAISLASIGSNRPPTRVAELDPGVDPDARRPDGPAEALAIAPGRGQESGLGVLGVQADLDRRARRRRRRVAACVDAERFARGDPQLVGHEVAARDELGDRVLDLEPRVHLEEEERRRASSSRNSHGARRSRSRRPRPSASAASPEPLAESPRRRAGDGRLLEDLLVAALDASSRARRGGRRAPCASNRTWTSTWRGPRRAARGSAGRRRTRPRPRDGPPASASASRAASRTIRMPLPPPPAAGLTRSG